MSPTFWSNTIWFILLGITTVIELIIIFLKVKNRKRVLALYLTICGITFCFEMVVYSFFKSYEYYPMLIPHSRPDDSIAGNLFSQFSVSATALLIAVFNLRYYWFGFFAVLYGVIEELFIKLGIYKHNWYRTWMTVIGLLVLFWIARKIYTVSLNHIGNFERYLYIFFGLVALHENTIVWVLRLTGIRVFSENFLSGKERSLVVLSATNMLLLGVIIMLLHFSNIKWLWKVVVISILYVVYFIAGKLHLILYKENFFLISTSISIWGMYFYTYVLDKLLGQSKRGISYNR